jgi:phosphate transport system protein
MQTHYEQSLQRDIDRIRSKVTEMGVLADRALRQALQALRERSAQVAYSVILRDQRIDELEKEVDRLCLDFLVRQQPVAGTLRFVYAAIRINLEIERVGDYAESIARQALALEPVEADLPIDRLAEIADVAIPMVQQAVRAFVERDCEGARKLMASEEAADVLRHKINAELVQMRELEQIPLDALAPLMMIANRLERVADQAKNICQEVVYMCTGEYTKHTGGDLYRVLFVDRFNACRSHMAEAAGNSLGQSKFLFTSAGLEPTRIDETTAAFLKEKGIDISHHTSRSIEQVLPLDQYQAIVALAEEARKIFPPPPRKLVCIDWSIQDPSKVLGTAEEVWAAYEHTFQYLKCHIQSLVDAILGDEASGG